MIESFRNFLMKVPYFIRAFVGVMFIERDYSSRLLYAWKITKGLYIFQFDVLKTSLMYIAKHPIQDGNLNT